MNDEYSDVNVYVPLVVKNGKLKKDNSFIFLTKELVSGKIIYYVYDGSSCSLKSENNIFRSLMNRNVTKLVKINSSQKIKYLYSIGKSLYHSTDQDSLKNFSKIVTREKGLVL